MKSDRLEAFTDGMIAIVLTIIVLEMKPPVGPSPEASGRLFPVLLAYAVSFSAIPVFWNDQPTVTIIQNRRAKADFKPAA